MDNPSTVVGPGAHNRALVSPAVEEPPATDTHPRALAHQTLHTYATRVKAGDHAA